MKIPVMMMTAEQDPKLFFRTVSLPVPSCFYLTVYHGTIAHHAADADWQSQQLRCPLSPTSLRHGGNTGLFVCDMVVFFLLVLIVPRMPELI
jgi:hypothetical protein